MPVVDTTLAVTVRTADVEQTNTSCDSTDNITLGACLAASIAEHDSTRTQNDGMSLDLRTVLRSPLPIFCTWVT